MATIATHGDPELSPARKHLAEAQTLACTQHPRMGPQQATECQFALPRHPERKLPKFAMTIVAPTADSFRFRPFGVGRHKTSLFFQKGAMTKRCTLGGGRGHASQEEEDEACDCRAQHDVDNCVDRAAFAITIALLRGWSNLESEFLILIHHYPHYSSQTLLRGCVDPTRICAKSTQHQHLPELELPIPHRIATFAANMAAPTASRVINLSTNPMYLPVTRL